MRPLNSLSWKLPLIASIVSLAVLGCARTAPPPGEGLPPSENDVFEIVGGDEADAAELFMRYLAPRYEGSADPETARVLIGAVPENLPVELPLPEGAIPVGSFAWPGRESTTILLDVNQPAETAVDYFVETLGAQGLRLPEMYQFGGFEPAQEFPQAYLCGDHDFYVYIVAGDINPEWSGVRILVQNDTEYGPCAVPPDEIVSGRYGTVPRLTTPPGAVWRRTDGGEGAGRSLWRMTDIQTEFTVAQLAAHFTPQLVDQDWLRMEWSRTHDMDWSLWTHTDEEGREWVGVLLVAKSGRLPDSKIALFRMYRPTSERCHSSYEPCLPAGIGDFDCRKESGSFGPNYVEDYVEGPVTVVGPDEFGLDPDGDGLACD